MSENQQGEARQDPAEPKQVDESVDTTEQASPPSVEVAPAQPEVNVSVTNPEPQEG